MMKFKLSGAILAWLLLAVQAKKKNRNEPHPHKGKLKPYSPGPFPNLKLSKADEAKLESGQAVMKQILPDSPEESGSAICVQDVHAPFEAVWYQILDLDNYTKKVAKVNENKNYAVVKNRDGTCRIKTKQVLGVLPGYSYESYFDHTYYPKQSSMVWTLDYEKTSDFDDVAGHWHVDEKKPGVCRVFYACDIKMKGAVPGPVLNFISKQALKQATAWVKKESEANPTLTIPAKYGGSGKPATVPPGGSLENKKLPSRGAWGIKALFSRKH